MESNNKVNEKSKKKSTPNKNWLLVLLLLIIVVIVVVVFVNKKPETSENVVEKEETEQTQTQTQFYKEENGIKVNTSNKLSETKEFEGLEISNVTLTEEAGNSTFIASAKNNNKNSSGEFFLDLKFVDKDNNEIATISCYVDKVEPGQSVELNASATASLADAYDYSIAKQEQ